MTPLTRLKIVVAAVAIAVWATGARLEDERLEWVGIALLAGAFLLRFLKPRDRL